MIFLEIPFPVLFFAVVQKSSSPTNLGNPPITHEAAGEEGQDSGHGAGQYSILTFSVYEPQIVFMKDFSLGMQL